MVNDMKKEETVMVHHIENGQIVGEVIKNEGLVIVDFFATWCGPCKRLAPVIEDLAKDYDGIAIVGKCDVEEDEDLAMRFGVRNIPTIVFIKDGKEVDRSVGLVPRPALEEKIKAML